jgi:hypothetical protein
MTERDTAWLAGLLEGEGCFYWNKSDGRRRRGRAKIGYPGVKLQMCDRDVVERAGSLLGVRVRRVPARNPKHKDQYACGISGWPAIRLMQAVRHLMGDRRKRKIDELIQNYSDSTPRENDTHCRRGHKYTATNVRVEADGARRCLQCQHERNWRSEARRRRARVSKGQLSLGV